MTRGSDCSGKVILYASLLEQAGVDFYRLVYYDNTKVQNNVRLFCTFSIYLSKECMLEAKGKDACFTSDYQSIELIRCPRIRRE